MKVTLQRVCSGANLAVGAALLIGVIFSVAGGLEDVRDVWVYALLGVLCAAVGGFLMVPLPGAVRSLSVPVALFSALVVLLLAFGGWTWDPSQVHAVNTVRVAAMMLMLLETVSVVAVWQVRPPSGRRRGSGPPFTPPEGTPRQENP